MSTRYLDPTNDVAFKRLFGTEDHKPLLISFLNAMLGLKNKQTIQNIQFISQEQVPLCKEAKKSILDIKCTDQSGHQYIVEMQNHQIPEFIKRTQYYVSHSYVSQSLRGTSHLHLKPIILIAITNHVLFPKKKRVISYHKTLDTHTQEHDLQDLSYVFIELPKFNKSEKELKTLQDKWLYFFKNWNSAHQIPPSVKENELLEAYNSMEQFNWPPALMEAYIKANIAIADEFESKRREFEKGKNEGFAQGVVSGQQQGFEKGHKQGYKKAQGEERAKLALQLMQKGFPAKDVADLLGLQESDIKQK